MKWKELYYFVDFDWKNIFALPYEITSETSLQSMQYQIIIRYFPCKSFVGLWNNDIDTKCTLCNDEETLEHYFFIVILYNDSGINSIGGIELLTVD